jgi:hypothetical protein
VKLTATAFCARFSAVAESVREPVNRQMTFTLARPSTAEGQRPADLGDRQGREARRSGHSALHRHPPQARPRQPLGQPGGPQLEVDGHLDVRARPAVRRSLINEELHGSFELPTNRAGRT